MKLDTCHRCGETKPVSQFKTAKKSKRGYTQPCKKCDCAKNKVNRQDPGTEHLERYLRIPWTRAA